MRACFVNFLSICSLIPLSVLLSLSFSLLSGQTFDPGDCENVLLLFLHPVVNCCLRISPRRGAGASSRQVRSRANTAVLAPVTLLAPPSERWKRVKGEAKIKTGEKSFEVLREGDGKRGVARRFTCVSKLSDDGGEMMMHAMYTLPDITHTR